MNVQDEQIKLTYCNKMCDVCKYPAKTAARREAMSSAAYISTQTVLRPDEEDEARDDVPRVALGPSVAPGMKKQVYIQPPAVVQQRHYPSAQGVTVLQEKRARDVEDDTTVNAQAAKRPRTAHELMSGSQRWRGYECQCVELRRGELGVCQEGVQAAELCGAGPRACSSASAGACTTTSGITGGHRNPRQRRGV